MFESVIEGQLLARGYVAITPEGFDRERTILSAVLFDLIRGRVPDHKPRRRSLKHHRASRVRSDRRLDFTSSGTEIEQDVAGALEEPVDARASH